MILRMSTCEQSSTAFHVLYFLSTFRFLAVFPEFFKKIYTDRKTSIVEVVRSSSHIFVISFIYRTAGDCLYHDMLVIEVGKPTFLYEL